MKTAMHDDQSGQALVELALGFVILCVFVFGIIDYGRAVYDVEVMKNLVGEGSSMASRGSTTAQTVQAVVNYAGSDINASGNGCVIVTQVENMGGGSYQVVAQTYQSPCGTSGTSKIGCLSGQGGCQNSSATIPAAAQAALTQEGTGFSIYVTEFYYAYSPITPVAAFLGSGNIPSQFYAVAYY